MKKSYYSNTVPAAEAANTSPIRVARGPADAVTMPKSSRLRNS